MKALGDKNKVVLIVLIVFLSIIALLRSVNYGTTYPNTDMSNLMFLLSSTVHLAVVIYWGFSINERVMKSHIKSYLLGICVMMCFFLFARSTKWSAFKFLNIEARFAWYLFYIPMTAMFMFSFFIALYMNKDESYKVNKIYNFIYVPAISFILLILTNDFHQLAFTFNPNFDNWNLDYGYGIVYYSFTTFAGIIIIITLAILLKKQRHMKDAKKVFLPLGVVALIALYWIFYVVQPGFVDRFVDLTTFFCFMMILFWESCIRIGVIHSNTKHEMFLKNCNIKMQLLNNNGEVALASAGAYEMKPLQCEILKGQDMVIEEENTNLRLKKIDSGYVYWQEDVTKVKELAQEIESINTKIVGEIKLLEYETKIKEKRVLLKRKTEIHDIISVQVFPYLEKISERILKSENTELETQKRLLGEINVISSYVKRKTNLLLKLADNIDIENEDMIDCYNESFRTLNFINCSSSVVYKPPKDIYDSTHLLCYDLFQACLEEAAFKVRVVYVTCGLDRKRFRFCVQVMSDDILDLSTLERFRESILIQFNGEIIVEKEDDFTHHIRLIIPYEEEVE